MPREFEIKTSDQILTKLKSDLNTAQSSLAASKKITDFSEGSIIYTILRSIAATISSFWGDLGGVTDSFYVSTATGEYLKKRLKDFNFETETGTKSAGTVLVVRPVNSSFSGSVTTGTQLYDGTKTFVVTQGTSNPFGPQSSVPKSQFIKVEAAANGNTTVSPNTNLTVGNSSIYRSLKFIVGDKIPTDLNSPTMPSTASSITGGTEGWSDAQARIEFARYIQNLGYGTVNIILAQLQNIEDLKGVQVFDNAILVNNKRITDQSGSLVVTVDPKVRNGLSIDPVLLSKIDIVMQKYKPAGIRYDVQLSPVLPINVSVVVYTDSQDSAARSQFETAIKTDLSSKFSGLAEGQSLYTRAIGSDLYALNKEVAKGGVEVSFTYAQNDPDNRFLAGEKADSTGVITPKQPNATTGEIGEILFLNTVTVSFSTIGQ